MLKLKEKSTKGDSKMKTKVLEYLLNKYNVRMSSFNINELKKELDQTKISDLILWCKVYGKK
jgi:hypothetical protein